MRENKRFWHMLMAYRFHAKHDNDPLDERIICIESMLPKRVRLLPQSTIDKSSILHDLRSCFDEITRYNLSNESILIFMENPS